MIQEAYVSFETAKLLKEKGFNQELDWVYSNKNGKIGLHYDVNEDGYGTTNDYFKDKDGCIAPTQQMAMRWLREVWNIVIVVQPVVGEIGLTWEYRIIKFHLGKGYGSINGTEFIKYGFKSYEEAVEAAIKCCLENLI